MLPSSTLRTFITNSGILVLGFGNSILLSRSLGPNGRGELAAAMLWPMLLVYLSSMGLMPSILYFTAQPDPKTDLIFANSIGFAIIQSLIVLPLGFVAIPWLLASQTSAVANIARAYLLVIPISLVTQYGISILQGRAQILSFNLLRTIIPFGYLLGTVLLKTLGGLTLLNIIVLHLSLNLLALVFTIIALLKAGIRLGFRPDKYLAKRMLKYGASVYVGDLSQGMNLRLDQALMAAMLPPVQLGIYIVAVSSASLSQVLSNSVRMVAIPTIARISSPFERSVVLKAIFRKYLLLSVPATLMIGLALPRLIPIVFGSTFKGAIWTAEVLLAGTFLLGAKDVLSGGAQALGNPWLSSRAELFSLIVTVTLLLLLLPSIGIMGAAIASVAVYATQLAIIIFGLQRSHSISPRSLFSVQTKDLKSLIGGFSLGTSKP